MSLQNEDSVTNAVLDDEIEALKQEEAELVRQLQEVI